MSGPDRAEDATGRLRRGTALVVVVAVAGLLAVAVIVVLVRPVGGASSTEAVPAPPSPARIEHTATPPPMSTVIVVPESYGAVGDGVQDDTRALQRALDAVPPGGTLRLTAGRTYAHSGVLQLRVRGEHLTGAAVLLATAEARSAVWITADDVTISGGVNLRTQHTTRRWTGYPQMGLRLAGVSGATISHVTVSGSAAAGIYVGRSCCTAPVRSSSDFTITDVTVSDTRADGIQLTGGAHNGTVRSATVRRSGDDGISVVSYSQDRVLCHDIAIESPTVRTSTGARGLSVVGGNRISYRDVDVDSTAAAAIYLANEGAPFYTMSTSNVTVEGGRLTRSNTDPAIDHGAVLVYSARSRHSVSNVRIAGLSISGTRAGAPWQVGVQSGGGSVSNVVFYRLHLHGGGTPFYANVPASDYRRVGWTVGP